MKRNFLILITLFLLVFIFSKKQNHFERQDLKTKSSPQKLNQVNKTKAFSSAQVNLDVLEEKYQDLSDGELQERIHLLEEMMTHQNLIAKANSGEISQDEKSLLSEIILKKGALFKIIMDREITNLENEIL